VPLTQHRIEVVVKPRQLAMIQSDATVLWIGAGTKTGKTVGLELWLAEGILTGKRTAWCGPWAPKTKMAYDGLKKILAAPEKMGEVRFNDSVKSIEAREGGGVFVPFTGDNPEAIYGDAFDRFVIDEASRQTEETFTAALTTISATHGQIRLAFNLDHGSKNWAIRNLLRVKNMTPEERAVQGEDYITMPTLDEGFVNSHFVEMMRSKMTEQMFRALYYAEIPESDVALFHNLKAVFSGKPVDRPAKGHAYAMGVDCARKHDWTVGVVVDTCCWLVVDMVRFNEISWNLQYSKLSDLYHKWRCNFATVDATGLGDPVVEELQKKGMTIEPLVFNPRNRHNVLEELVIAFDQMTLRLPDVEQDDRFAVVWQELESFEYAIDDDGKVTYRAPSNMHDDTVIALALAIHGLRNPTAGRMQFMRGSEDHVTTADLAGF
jgi:hypothetical protein